MIKDDRKTNENESYTFFKRFGKPIRNVMDEKGCTFAADVLDIENGQLIRKVAAVEPDFHDPYADEITEKEFYALCESLIQTRSKS